MSIALEVPRNYRMSALDWGLFVLCAVLWGSAYTFNKLTIAEIAPLSIAASRLAIAALFLFVIARIVGHAFPTRLRDWRPFLVFTMFSNVVPFLLVLRGQRETASGLAAVLGATVPLFLIPLAHYYTNDEKLMPRKVAGVLVGLLGVAVVVGTEAFSGWSDALDAKLALVGASLLYAVGAIYSKRLVAHPPLVLSTMQMTSGFLITAPLAILIDRPWNQPWPSDTAIAALLATAILASALSSLLYFYVFRRAGATNAMLVTLLVPVTPILLGAFMFGERLAAREATGAVIIALALVIVDGRLGERLAAAMKPNRS